MSVFAIGGVRRLRSTWALALLTALGCGGAQNTPSPFQRGGRGSEQVTLLVENLDFNEATLHSVAEGARALVGRVPGKTNGTFTLAWPTVRDLQIQIDLLASDRFTTQRLTVTPGDRLTLVIQTPVNRSFLRR